MRLQENRTAESPHASQPGLRYASRSAAVAPAETLSVSWFMAGSLAANCCSDPNSLTGPRPQPVARALLGHDLVEGGWTLHGTIELARAHVVAAGRADHRRGQGRSSDGLSAFSETGADRRACCPRYEAQLPVPAEPASKRPGVLRDLWRRDFLRVLYVQAAPGSTAQPSLTGRPGSAPRPGSCTGLRPDVQRSAIP